MINCLAKFLVITMLVFVSCSSGEDPQLVGIKKPGAPVLEQTATPSPEDYFTGSWATVISDIESGEINGITAVVRQLRFTTPSRMLTEMSDADKTKLGLEKVASLIVVRITIENNTNKEKKFNPSDFDNILTIEGIDYRPIPTLSGSEVVVSSGEKLGFSIAFPVGHSLDDFDELTFKLDGLEFLYTDLMLSPPIQ